MQLGKLEKIKDLRTVWPHEALDFTNWLAKEENLKILSDELGIDIELIATEVKTGSFNTDILAKDANTEDKIVIENQLERTNHDHLGKIITYASGHDANTIIWIVKEAREEHRQAVDWLNEHTDEDINIFLCRIELWKIGDSPVAPKFQIVSQPNEWTKTLKQTSTDNLTSGKVLKLNYWTSFVEKLNEDYPLFNSRKPRPSNFYSLSLGSSLAHISLTISPKNKEIRAQIWISDSKELFDYLFESKDEIESESGLNFVWSSVDAYKSSRILIKNNIDVNNESNWDEAIKWQLDTAEKLYNVFSDRIKEFN